MDMSMPLGLLLSPEHIAVAGNGFGATGLLFAAGLAVAGAFQGGTALALDSVDRNPAAVDGLDAAKAVVRFLLFAFFGTLVLATGGYIFNEVFWHAFPNLLFSFLMLVSGGLVMALASDRWVRLLIKVMACITVLGLLLLAVLAWFPENPDSLSQAPEFSPVMFLLALPLVAGFDLADRGGARSMLLALLLLVVVHFLWGLGELHVVTRERLASSTVPHMSAARRIMGDEARMVMGAAMLAATFGGVLALLSGIVRPLGKLRGGPLTGWGRFWTVLAACGAPALLMGFGFAGEEVTESFLRGSLAAIFAMYLASCVMAWRDVSQKAWLVGGGGISLASGVVVVLNSDIPAAALGVLLLAACLYFGLRRFVRPPERAS